MHYNITNADGVSTAFVFGEDGTAVVLSSTAPTYAKLIEYLLQNHSHDIERVHALVNPAVYIGSELAKITGGRVTYDNRNVFLDGKPFAGALGQHLADKISQADEDWARFARFIVKLDQNTSRRAREELFQFLEKNGLTITEDGNFISYKGVDYDGNSITAGTQPFKIDGVSHNREGNRVKIPNAVGTTISVKRRDVDDDFSRGCSYGLHVGSHSYASTFGHQRLLTVEVNPRDVVTVPNEDANKMRVRAYKVLEINEGRVQFTATSWHGEPDEDPDAEIEWRSCSASELEEGDTYRLVGDDEAGVVAEIQRHKDTVLVVDEDGERFLYDADLIVEFLYDSDDA